MHIIKLLMLMVVAPVVIIIVLEAGLLVRLGWNVLRGKGCAVAFTKKARIIHAFAIPLLGCMAYAYFIEPYWIEVNQFTIETDKLADTSFRIVQLSDVHCDVKQRNEAKIVEIVNGLKPDVVVFTGDISNVTTGPDRAMVIEQFKQMMTAIKADNKIAVYGNWDGHVKNGAAFEGTGFKVLQGQSITVKKDGEKILFAGIDMWCDEDYKDLLAGNSSDAYNVLLYHYSDLAEDLGELNVDLYLSGHTHGGQIALPFYGAVITLSKFGKKYEAGLYEVDDMVLYVNRGIGMEGMMAPRMRFCARPEIAVFDIVPEAEGSVNN
ncbi:MAG: metallophosphoesterase [Anaerohalosphaera sp.]|nr:metallophosphoesterase [Anaerohalosphaera sp.]